MLKRAFNQNTQTTKQQLFRIDDSEFLVTFPLDFSIAFQNKNKAGEFTEQ